MKVAIIGSFRKNYDEIAQFIRVLREKGYIVTSPFLSQICDSREDFVIFEEDDSSQTNDEIQTETLRKIMKADVVYVFNNEGYVGQTTCFEIGYLMANRRPLYFKEYLKDLPIPVAETHILSPEDFVKAMEEKRIFYQLPIKEKVKNQNDLESVYGVQPKLVICGSMKAYGKMQEIKRQFTALGVYAIIPDNEGELSSDITEEAFNEYKKRVSKAYLNIIRSKGTFAVLIVNEEKNGISNYIGANTFVELATAFSWYRKIFLYNDIYDQYRDELVGWGAIPIHKDLSIVMQEYSLYANKLTENRLQSEPEYQQLTLLEYM